MGKYIVIGDIHLRRSVPICRMETEDEWCMLQTDTLMLVAAEAIRRDCEILIVGDIYDTAVAASAVQGIFVKAFYEIRDRVYILAGNHDLPEHNLNNMKHSSYGLLTTMFKQIPGIKGKEFDGHHFGTEYNGDSSVICTHQFVVDSDKEREIMGGGKSPEKLVEMYKNPKFIFVGDYHKNFVAKVGDCYVVNPGCSTRQTAKFKDYTPVCYYVDTETSVIETIKLADNDSNAISNIHIIDKNVRDERMTKFMEVVTDTESVTLDFIGNLQDSINNNAVQEACVDSTNKRIPDVVTKEISDIVQHLKTKEEE